VFGFFGTAFAISFCGEHDNVESGCFGYVVLTTKELPLLESLVPFSCSPLLFLFLGERCWKNDFFFSFSLSSQPNMALPLLFSVGPFVFKRSALLSREF